ncbi:MAG: pseudouridine-5'-phosphate glycosidase, partial [Gaiellales bacterium]
MSERFEVSDEIAAALRHGGPVVALETTLVTHGLPHPLGLETAVAMEDRIRQAGALPATIGILDGKLRVGLGPEELRSLATSSEVAKVNLGNLAAQIASGKPGSTTVAASLFAAARAGIRVFATGGIGGVHRGDGTWDVSGDLLAISRYPVAVVCAGAKAILDLPRTVEMLETLGVPILGVGVDRFPAFYRRDSGISLDAGFPSIASLAAAVRTHFAIGTGTGLIVANPIPAEQELPSELVDSAIERAIAAAASGCVRGRDVT